MPRPRPSARELIGGRWAISLRAFVTVSVVLVAATLLGPPVPSWSPTTRLLAAATQILGMGLILLLADRTLFRHRRAMPVPIVAVALLGATIGLQRVVTMTPGPSLVDAPLPDTGTLIRVTIEGVIALGAIYPTLAYLLAARDWYTSERTRLIALDVRASAERLRAAGALDATLDATLAAIESALDDTRTTTAALLSADEPDTKAIASGLIEAARATMRPLSHDLWIAREPPYPAVRWRQVAASEVRSHPLPQLVPTVGFVAITTVEALAILGVLGCMATLLAGTLSINACFRLGRAGVRRHRARALPIACASIVGAALPPMLVALWFGASPGRALLMLPLLAGLTVTAGVVAAVGETSDAVVRDLARFVREKEIEQIALVEADQRLRRDVATYLHSTVQTDLISAGLTLRNAAVDGETSALECASASAFAALELRYDPDEQPTRQSLPELIETTTRRWSGILDLEWNLSDATVLDDQTPTIAAILRESLANAMVHGAATRATISLGTEHGPTQVTVSDNGVGPQPGPRGLGSALLDDATGGQWTLSIGDNGGATVVATLPA